MSLSANFPAIRPSLLLDFANTKALDPRITFTRATTATYYDGVTTALAEQNLSPYSEQFDNAFWVKANSTVTANATTAPDGTVSADSFVVTASGALTAITSSSSGNVGVSGQPLVISIYAKANTATVIQLSPATGVLSAGYANFDLSGGTVGNIGGTGLTASIVSVGSGWYRCVMTIASASGAGAYTVAIVDSTTSARQSVYTGSAGNALYIWGIQAEQRSAVTAYTATTTQAITNYIPVLKTAAANVARFDHNPTTDESLGLLVEEQRTNVALYSEQFDNAAWIKGSATITANTVVAPDGTLTGDAITEDTATSTHQAYQSTSFTSGVAYTYSVYAKQGVGTRRLNFSFLAGAFTTELYVTFNLTTGTVSAGASVTASITPVGNGWYRCSATATATATASSGVVMRLGTSDAAVFFSYTGNGYSGIYIWGAQLEAGSFATSYIPTVATTVQRNADLASMTGTNFSSWYNAAEGTLYADSSGTQPFNVPTSAAVAITALSDGSANNRVDLRLQGGGGSFYSYVASGGVSVAVINNSGTYAPNTIYKAAVVYRVNDFARVNNGGTVATATSGAVPSGVNQLRIGTTDGGVAFINGYVRRIAYYPIRVTDAQLQALTS